GRERGAGDRPTRASAPEPAVRSVGGGEHRWDNRAMTTRPLTLVTGGAGYVGSLVVDELLSHGAPVRVLDTLLHGSVPSLLGAWGRPGFEFIRGDVRDPQITRAALADVDAVVHLAAIVGDPACARDPGLARSVNLDATRALLGGCEELGVRRVVFASTCSNYGKMPGDVVATEDFDLRPVSLYAETKVAAELDVLARGRNGLETCCLRFATVYGSSPRMRFDLTVNEFTRDLVLGEELVVYGEQFCRPYSRRGPRGATRRGGRGGLQRGMHRRELPQARHRRAAAGAPPRCPGALRAQGRGPA